MGIETYMRTKTNQTCTYSSSFLYPIKKKNKYYSYPFIPLPNQCGYSIKMEINLEINSKNIHGNKSICICDSNNQ